MSLRVAEWNCNGILSSKGELELFLARYAIDVMCLCETKLGPQHNVAIPGYQVHRKDGNSPRQGGVIVLVKDNLPHVRVEDPQIVHLQAVKVNRCVFMYYFHYQNIKCRIENLYFSIFCFQVQFPRNLTIVGAYNSPRSRLTRQDMRCLMRDQRCLLLGDLNAKHVTWNCHQNNTNGIALKEYVERTMVILLVPDRFTHWPQIIGYRPTTIDLVLAKNVPQATDVRTIEELNSDHFPILMDVTYGTPNRDSPPITVIFFPRLLCVVSRNLYKVNLK